jgi:diphthamide synthase subunit DPH2
MKLSKMLHSARLIEERMTKYRHIKRNKIYEVISDTASLQCSTAQEFEDRFADQKWTVYRNVETGEFRLRLTEEFLDGRFEPIPD